MPKELQTELKAKKSKLALARASCSGKNKTKPTFRNRQGQIWLICRRKQSMNDHQDTINRLLVKLETLMKRQESFSQEIQELSLEINRLKSTAAEERPESLERIDLTYIREPQVESAEVKEAINSIAGEQIPKKTPIKQYPPQARNTPKISIDLEKFIGENLINKIGIAITVIGVAIGAKYSIEHELISPLTRIILGYLSGLGLLGFGMKLKKNYESYSAVLVSGAISILYFITYSAYSFYALFPQTFAFTLMVIFTVFAVLAAINYNKQVIAHIGLVGAYAVPFLLSEGSGQVAILFSYMTIINLGILIIAFKKYWKPLYYLSFGFTWLIYFFWYTKKYETSEHFELALLFLSIFFALFYLTFLAYKLLRKEKFESSDVLMLLINSFIFYSLGYVILANQESGKQVLGLFTLGNALIHFIFSAVIYKQKLGDKNLFYMISGLVLLFITIAIPVQLDGNWVTLMWAGEAALLFWIGRTKHVSVYEKLSYPLMLLAFFSIFHDWTSIYDSYVPEYPETRIRVLFNINFLSSLLFLAAFAFINILNQSKKYVAEVQEKWWFSKFTSFAIPAIFLLTLYYAFRIEITTYWDQLYSDSLIVIPSEGDQYSKHHHNFDLRLFKVVWTSNYSLLFLSLLAFVNIKKLKNKQLGFINLALITLTLTLFFMGGLYSLNALRESYLEQHLSEYYQRGLFNIGIRYISFAFVALGLFACYRYTRQAFIQKDLKLPYDLLLHISILWTASSELINYLEIAESAQSDKLGLSILWGVYALLLISLGIWKKKKHLRVGAFLLFGITLLKLFFYDISHLDTIAKTVVFVSLGVLLLIISFLYNKFKHVITDEAEK